MKKILAILMTVCMVMTSLLIPGAVFAQDSGDESQTINVEFTGNGGNFSFKEIGSDEAGEPREYYSVQLSKDAANKSIGAALNSITGGTYWTERTFKGWQPMVERTVQDGDASWIDWVAEGETLYSNTDVLKYEPTENTMMKAVWEGDDAEYYSTVRFHAYDGIFVYNEVHYEDNQKKTIKQEVGDWNDKLKEGAHMSSDPATIRDQTGAYFEWVSDPVKENGADFEGWMKFKLTQIEHEDGVEDKFEYLEGNYLTTDAALNEVVADDDIVYVAKWSDMEVEDYFKEGGDDGEGGEGDDEQFWDPNMLEFEYRYYKEDGEWDIYYTAVEINGRTYKEVIREAEEQVKSLAHYRDKTTGFEFTGWEYMPLPDNMNEPAKGGWMGVSAQYNDKLLVMVDFVYYDETADSVTKSVPVVIEKGQTFKDVYDLVIEKTEVKSIKHFADYGFKRWESEARENTDAVPVDEMAIRIQVAAIYQNCPMEFKYSYLENGKVITKSTGKIKVDGETPVLELFMEKRPQDIPTTGITTWAFHPNNRFETYPTAATQMIWGAAQYDSDSDPMTPVFVDRCVLEYDALEAIYQVTEKCDELYYVNTAIYNREDAQQFDDFEAELMNTVKGQNSEHPGKLTLQGYEPHDFDVERDRNYERVENYIQKSNAQGDPNFKYAMDYNIKAIYDKALLVLEYPDGIIEQKLMPAGTEYTAPSLYTDADGYTYKMYWTREEAFRGGDGVRGGETLTVMSPFLKLSAAYKVEYKNLTEKPEGVKQSLAEIKLMLKEKVIDGVKFFETKVRIKYLDISLKNKNENGKWVDVEAGDFPAEGMVIYIPYPEGTSAATHDFAVTHFISNDNDPNGKKGDVEQIQVKETEYGLELIVHSMSPFGVISQETGAIPIDSEQEDADTEDPETGDSFLRRNMLVLIMVTSIIAIIGLICFNKRKINKA